MDKSELEQKYQQYLLDFMNDDFDEFIEKKIYSFFEFKEIYGKELSKILND